MERRKTRLGSKKAPFGRSIAGFRTKGPFFRGLGCLAARRFPAAACPRPATSVAEPRIGPGREPSATDVAGRGQAAAGNRRAARQPSPRKNGPLVLNPAMERPKGAFFTTKARLSALHLPSKSRGDQLKAQLARRRGNASAWLFESTDQNSRQDVATHAASYAGLTRVSITLRKDSCAGDGLPGQARQ